MNSIDIAIWDDPITRAAFDPIDSSTQSVCRSSFVSVESCIDRVRAGTADVAVIPASEALSHSVEFDIHGDWALSSWSNPDALIDRQPPGTHRRVHIDPAGRHPYVAFVAAVILKEHYGLEVARASDSDAHTDVRPLPPGTPLDPGVHIDLSSEWSELNGYPMVWALMIARKGGFILPVHRALEQWIRSTELRIPDDRERTVRLRLDNVAAASLTELGDYLYYYGESSRIPVFSPVSSPSERTIDE